jgi:hypothetical protein
MPQSSVFKNSDVSLVVKTNAVNKRFMKMQIRIPRWVFAVQ